MTDKLRVAVLFGGRSGEHEVSLQSAAAVLANLDREAYEVMAIGIAKDGQWRLCPPGGGPWDERWWEDGQRVALLPIPAEGRLYLLDEGRFGPQVDVFIPILHGPMGEDGTIQGLFELAGAAYVGAGVTGSAVGMDKDIMKRVFQAAGLPTARHMTIRRKEWEEDPDGSAAKIAASIGFPCFVKPVALGSSVGVSMVRDKGELERAMALAGKYHHRILIEVSALPCQEVECAVLGNESPEASIVGEIVPGNQFYDYRAKYIDDNSQLIIPARLSPGVEEKVKELAVKAFQAIDCMGMARVDFFVRPDGSVLVNEINTIPGFTRISMYPKLWEASGLTFSQLLDRLIKLALEHHREKSRSTLFYEEDA
ncbi:MAG: D-alanine--D-alanine ligase [Firmicutes bacterium]|nr:D-alanine--D-alanine ligase [Bacillota bacterium]